MSIFNFIGGLFRSKKPAPAPRVRAKKQPSPTPPAAPQAAGKKPYNLTPEGLASRIAKNKKRALSKKRSAMMRARYKNPAYAGARSADAGREGVSDDRH